MLRMYEDALGTPREAVMRWVVELLFPTLLGWNQWVWRGRRYVLVCQPECLFPQQPLTAVASRVFGRYNVGADAPHGGLIVLGADMDTRPCEGGTVTEPQSCGGKGAAILESGMDNSPMYYNAFDDGAASFDSARGRLQLYDVQQSALFVSESLALQQLAQLVAGAETSLALLQQQSATMAALINGSLWDDATGIYRQRDATGATHSRAHTHGIPSQCDLRVS